MTPSRAASYPFLGTWKMTSIETSHPHLPHPAASTVTFSERDGAIHYSAESTWTDGRKTHVHAVVRMDGKYHALHGSAIADSVSLKDLGGGAFEGHMKKGDASAGTNHASVSADGKTMTGRWDLAAPDGVTVVWKTVSARQ